MRLIFSFLVVAALAACTTSDVMMTGNSRPAITPDAVRVYLRHPDKFESIALITANSNTTPSRSGNKKRVLLDELKKKAAAVGANGIVMTVTDGGESARTMTVVPAGTSAVGVMTPGKGPMVEMQAEAIFVDNRL